MMYKLLQSWWKKETCQVIEENTHKFYEDIVNLLLKELYENNIISSKELLTFIASRRETNKHLNIEFIRSLSNVANLYNVHMDVQIKASYDEKWLQVVDLVARSVFQKYENKDNQYYEIIAPLITTEKPYTQRNLAVIAGGGNHTDTDA